MLIDNLESRGAVDKPVRLRVVLEVADQPIRAFQPKRREPLHHICNRCPVTVRSRQASIVPRRCKLTNGPHDARRVHLERRHGESARSVRPLRSCNPPDTCCGRHGQDDSVARSGHAVSRRHRPPPQLTIGLSHINTHMEGHSSKTGMVPACHIWVDHLITCYLM